MISKAITTNYEKIQLTKELQTAFSNSSLDVTFRGNTVEVGVEATSENINLLDATVAAHDYSAGVIEKIKNEIRAKRNPVLAKVDGIRNGYKRQVDLGITPSITEEKYLEWCRYGQDWCDLPATITQANQIPIYPSEPI